MTQPFPLTSQEWLEADGLGGSASGTVSGIRTRRYHALLGPATAPPGGRMVLVNGFDAFVETEPGVRHAISSQRYGPDVLHPDGWTRLEEFSATPWPRWVFRLDPRLAIEQQLVVERGTGRVALSFSLRGRRRPATLHLRPFLSGRDHHALQRENGLFRFEAELRGDSAEWRPYEGVPPVVVRSNGSYCPDPQWYREFLYEEERARGYDHTESLASPGVFRFDLSKGEAWLVLSTSAIDAEAPAIFRSERRRRSRLAGPLARAADAYVVSRGEGKSIVAGYPWFGEWGRDTFIAMRGLCLATGRVADAREILLGWAALLSEGMLPGRLPGGGLPPEYDSVDSALWFAVAVGDLLRRRIPAKERRLLLDAVEAIIEGYAKGTRHGIRLDDDGLLAAGAPGRALTWMGERTGKPVEVQELWFRTLEVSGKHGERLARGLASFRAKFWDPERSRLFDVVDADHEAGRTDVRFRPNQILAASRFPRAKARAVVDAVEASLWTPAGLRSLAPDEPQYRGRCEGGAEEREAAATLGAVWPWLAGPFVEAWLHVRGNGAGAKRQARVRFLEPLLASIGAGGIGHLPEIADGDPPHAPRGCPFQAWSVGEALRLDRQILR